MILLLFLIYITRISTLRAVCRKRNNWLEIHKILWHKCVYICKILFPWAQEESSSRRQWVCWCCRMHCSTEIPSLNRLAGTLGNRAATEHQFGAAHPPRMVCELFKTFKPFFPLIPGSLTVVLKSQSVWWGHADTGCNAAVLSQCANHVEKVQAVAEAELPAHALCRAVRQAQDWTPGCSKKAQVSWARVALP